MDADSIRRALGQATKPEKKVFEHTLQTPLVLLNTTRAPTREETIIRQNALSHADALMQTFFDRDQEGRPFFNEKTYFDFAKRCEGWVLRKVSE